MARDFFEAILSETGMRKSFANDDVHSIAETDHPETVELEMLDGRKARIRATYEQALEMIPGFLPPDAEFRIPGTPVPMMVEGKPVLATPRDNE